MVKYYTVAAKWWADKLRNVTPAHFPNATKIPKGDLAVILASNINTDTQLSANEIGNFEKMLAKVIRDRVETYGSISLRTAYEPDCILTTIAKETGVSPQRFPCQSSMLVTPSVIKIWTSSNFETIEIE